MDLLPYRYIYEKLAKDFENKENSFFGAYSHDSLVGAKHEDRCSYFIYLVAKQYSKLRSQIDQTRPQCSLENKCENNIELQQRIATYRDELHINPAVIKIHPDNGGPPDVYGHTHLGIPVGNDIYCKNEFAHLVDQYVQSAQCDNDVESVHQK